MSAGNQPKGFFCVYISTFVKAFIGNSREIQTSIAPSDAEKECQAIFEVVTASSEALARRIISGCFLVTIAPPRELMNKFRSYRKVMACHKFNSGQEFLKKPGKLTSLQRRQPHISGVNYWSLARISKSIS
ncbi:hypothetical protein BELL_0002g00190 [Botrytis elliptica]|uniref:Uncharacterized protein n=1 Tax=Botrytis elliptica TaxID=278938 RepID=A0A4Z1KGW1_9HELO|nr:hypothetical protein BELL_0002g00190 [Botrytis elliptica]